jgi:hypothetical protein
MMRHSSSTSSCATSGALSASALRRSASSAVSGALVAAGGVAAAGHSTRAEALGFGSRTHDQRSRALIAVDAPPALAPSAPTAQAPHREPTHRELAEKEAELARVIATADQALAASASQRRAGMERRESEAAARAAEEAAADTYSLLSVGASRLEEATCALSEVSSRLSGVEDENSHLRTEVDALRKMLVSRSTLLAMQMPTPTHAQKRALSRGESTGEKKMSEAAYREAANALTRSWSAASAPARFLGGGADGDAPLLRQGGDSGGGARRGTGHGLGPEGSSASLSSRPGSAGRLVSGKTLLPVETQLSHERHENRTIVAMKAQINRMSSEISRCHHLLKAHNIDLPKALPGALSAAADPGAGKDSGKDSGRAGGKAGGGKAGSKEYAAVGTVGGLRPEEAAWAATLTVDQRMLAESVGVHPGVACDRSGQCPIIGCTHACSPSCLRGLAPHPTPLLAPSTHLLRALSAGPLAPHAHTCRRACIVPAPCLHRACTVPARRPLPSS